MGVDYFKTRGGFKKIMLDDLKTKHSFKIIRGDGFKTRCNFKKIMLHDLNIRGGFKKTSMDCFKIRQWKKSGR
jgi:hypothetical protein